MPSLSEPFVWTPPVTPLGPLYAALTPLREATAAHQAGSCDAQPQLERAASAAPQLDFPGTPALVGVPRRGHSRRNSWRERRED